MKSDDFDDIIDITVGAVEEAVDAGFPMEEAADIVLEQFQHQITDAPQDPNRVHGSAHRGASYLQESSYPPHGASAGQEGGLVDIEERLEVFGDKMSKNSHNDIEILGALARAQQHPCPVTAEDLLAQLGSWTLNLQHVVAEIGDLKRQGVDLPDWAASDLLQNVQQSLVGILDLTTQVESGLHTAQLQSMHQNVAQRVSSVARRAATILGVRGKDLEIFGEEGKDINILGHHYTHGLDVLGGAISLKAAAKTAPKPVTTSGKVAAAKKAVQPRAGFVLKSTPGGKKITSLVLNTPKRGDNKASIKNAQDAGKRAISVGNKLNKALATARPVAKTAAKVAVHGAPALRAPARVPARGGVVKHRAHPMTKAQMKKAADTAIKAGNEVLKAADSHGKLVSSFAAKTKAAIAQGRKVLGPAGKVGTRVQGDSDLAILGATLDAACDVFGATSDPNHPGYLTDGSPDPAYAGGGFAAPDASNPGYLTYGSPDPAYYASDPNAVDAAMPGPPDYGFGPPPTAESVAMVPNQDYFPDPSPNAPDANSYSFSGDLPAGAIVYDWSAKHMPWQGVGSYTRFYPSDDKSDGHGPSGFQWGGGDPGIMDGWYWWWHGAQSGTEYKHEKAGNEINSSRAGVLHYQGTDSTPERANVSNTLDWGPLIGNPNGWTKSLRYDKAGDRWFWFYDTAPDWAKQSIDSLRLNQAILDYKANITAAAADAAAQAMQDQLDAQQAAELAKQQAAEDAQIARQQQQEQTEMEHEAALQAVADETSAKQTAAQQELDDASAIRQAQAQAEIDRQAMEQQAMLEERAAEVAARLQAEQDQHDMEMAQRLDAMAPPDGGYADQGDQGDSGYDDSAVYDNSGPVDDGSDIDNLEDAVLGDWEQGEGGSDAWERGEDLRGSAKYRARSQKRRG